MFLNNNVKVVRLIFGAHASIRTPPPVVPIGCLPFGQFCAFSVVHLVLEARLSRMKNVIGCACSAREGTDPIKCCSFFVSLSFFSSRRWLLERAGAGFKGQRWSSHTGKWVKCCSCLNLSDFDQHNWQVEENTISLLCKHRLFASLFLTHITTFY